jgi:hypothetical protein
MIPLGNEYEIHVSMRGTLFLRRGREEWVISPNDFADLISSYLGAKTSDDSKALQASSDSSLTLLQRMTELASLYSNIQQSRTQSAPYKSGHEGR